MNTRPVRPELGVACRKCGAQPGQHCHAPSGRVTNFHTVRLHDATPDAPEDAQRRIRERLITDAQFDRRTLVTVSFGYACGCTQPPGEPLPLREANAFGVGYAIICDTHDEYTVVTRVTTRMIADQDTLTRILTASDIDPVTADAVASDQTDDARAERLRAGLGSSPR